MLTAEDFANAIGSFRREMAGIARRMLVGRSDGGIWQAVGHLLLDNVTREAPDVPHFPGIGIFARPPDGGDAELIVLQVGGPNGKASIAARDEATRAKVNDVAADESALYNSLARVYVKADGTVEVRAHNGAALSLPTMADFNALLTIMSTCGAGASTALPLTLSNYQAAHPSWPDGTKKLKGQ